MSVRSNILAAIAAGAILNVVSPASAATYDVNLLVGDATATGFFSGIIGNSNSYVGAPFNLTLTEGSTNITLVGGINGEVAVSPPLGNAVTVTATQVLFNFSATDQEFLEFYLSGAGLGSGPVLCFETYDACGGSGPGIVIITSTGGPFQFQSETGNQVIASVEATPLPAALPLFASVLGGMGFLGWRR